jgi:hypothetical protein
MTTTTLRTYRGFTIVPIVDDETGIVFQYDVHGPECGPVPEADAPTVDTVPTILAARMAIRDEIAYRRLTGETIR